MEKYHIEDNKLIEKLVKDVDMSKYTTFRTGGRADYMAFPSNTEELSYIVKALNEEKIPYFIMGRGSNLLVKDSGISGVVINTSKFKGVKILPEGLLAYCGALLTEASYAAYDTSQSGMEFLSGIPGSVGGGVYMNAGAYSSEINDIIVSVEAMDREGNIRSIDKNALKLAYRRSVFCETQDLIVSAKFKLCKDRQENIKEEIKRLNAARREKQPLNYPSAGSTFKRPEGYYAAKLIEDSGLKGYRIGGAMVSEKHAGFIINYDNATSNDIINLIEHVRETVFNLFQVMLEPEVKIVGRD